MKMFHNFKFTFPFSLFIFISFHTYIDIGLLFFIFYLLIFLKHFWEIIQISFITIWEKWWKIGQIMMMTHLIILYSTMWCGLPLLHTPTPYYNFPDHVWCLHCFAFSIIFVITFDCCLHTRNLKVILVFTWYYAKYSSPP